MTADWNFLALGLRSRAEGAWRPFPHVLLVLALIMAQMVILPQPARADVVGTVTETAVIENDTAFVDLEEDEIQQVWNDATDGTFSLTFEGQTTAAINDDGLAVDEVEELYNDATTVDEIQKLYNDATTVDEIQELYNDATSGSFTITFDTQTTGALAYNAAAPNVETALEGLANITDVTVTGTGISTDPWVITFLDPGDQDVAQITTDDTSLNGTSTITTTTEGNDGGTFTITFDTQTTGALAYNAAAPNVETALEALANITDVTVTGTGASSDPWVITFLDPGDQDVAQITTDDTSLNGTSTITTTTEGAPSLEAALEALTNVTDVTVTGAGTTGDRWTITFLDPGAMNLEQMTATDSLVDGTTSINTVNNGLSTPIDPAGIAHLGSSTFLVSDSEINEEPTVYDRYNLWEMSTTPVIDESSLGEADYWQPVDPEPNGLAYNPDNGHLYISNDDAHDSAFAQGLIEIDPGVDGVFGTGDDIFVGGLDTAALSVAFSDIADVAWDPVGDQIFIAWGKDQAVTAVSPGANGVFDGTPSGDPAGDDVEGDSFDLSYLDGDQDIEGIGYRAVSDTLLITDSGNIEAIHEITKDGRLVRTIDIQALQLQGTAFKPADIDIDPSTGHMYVVDRVADNNASEPPPRDGRLYQLSSAFTNLEPFVDAGADQEITIGDPLTLVGDSYDDGQPTPAAPTWTWAKVSGPGTVTFTSANALTTDVDFSDGGVYELSLTADDGVFQSVDQVTVTVNEAPVVDAGVDQEIEFGLGATLDGTVTDDGIPNPPGTVTTLWEKVSGPGEVTFGDNTLVDTTASFSEGGVYVLELTADDSLLTGSDTVTIEVNTAPSVDAGPDDTVNVDDGANLDGTVTDDGLPTSESLTTTWDDVSGPGPVDFGDASAVDTTASFNAPGEYVLRLTANDGSLVDSDTVTIVVNTGPSVDAGPDQVIEFGLGATLDGTVTDDGEPDPPGTVTTKWVKISGPGTVTFADDEAVDTTASFSASGVYVLELTADDSLFENSDEVEITANVAPSADAGSDQEITLPGTASLTGSASDDGLPDPPGELTTTWSKISGPGTVNFTDGSKLSAKAAFSTDGTYVLRLTAHDGAASDTDDVTITVKPPPNSAPTVDAGPNQTIDFGDSANLSGSASDDGLPDPPGSLTFSWSKVSGPGDVGFSEPSKLNTNATFSLDGVYVLRLAASDGLLSASDDVAITVDFDAGSIDSFVDDDGSVFENAIEWLAAVGITKGCNPPDNDRYCPDDFVTRGQMAAFLVRALGYSDGLGADLFVDDDSSVFENAIDRLGTAGVTKGCNPPENDRYCPDDFVTRGQMAAFLVRAFGYSDGLGADLFVDDDSSVFENAIDRLGTAGVTKGCNPPDNDRYCPDDFVTRGQMAAFIRRALTG